MENCKSVILFAAILASSCGMNFPEPTDEPTENSEPTGSLDGSSDGSLDGSSDGNAIEDPEEETQLEKINVVLILADDLGYGSTNCYGADNSVLKTPQIDRLAEQGVRFTNASTPSSVCSPTRYGLLMGRYPWRTGMRVGVVNPMDPLWPSTQRTSLAKWLKSHGYATATIGKWHLGYGTRRHTQEPKDWVDTTTPGPESIGFDYSFNVPQNHGDMFGVYFENGKIVGFDQHNNLVELRSTNKKDYGNTTYGGPFIGFDVPQRVDELVTEQITTKAIAWMKQQVEKGDKPFFLYFAPIAVHNPITPSEQNKGQSNAGSYGDFIQDLDGSVGRILDALDEMGVTDETMVIFSSDNGGQISEKPNQPQFQAIQKGLAINGALRGGKHTIWEGGTRVPLIVRMPKLKDVKVGAVSDALVNLIDIFATVADTVIDGEELGNQVAPDSISFLHALKTGAQDESTLRQSSVTASAKGIIAIRRGIWKWIEGLAPEGQQAPVDQAKPQLYNLRQDLGENKDRSDTNPDIVNQLKKELKTIRDSN